MRLVLALHFFRALLVSKGFDHVVPDDSNVPVAAPPPGPRSPGARGTGEALRQVGGDRSGSRSHGNGPAKGVGSLFFHHAAGIQTKLAQAISYPRPAARLRDAVSGRKVRIHFPSREEERMGQEPISESCVRLS